MESPAIIEPAQVPCVLLAGGKVDVIDGFVYFTGWELIPPGIGWPAEYRVAVRTVAPLHVAEAINSSAARLIAPLSNRH